MFSRGRGGGGGGFIRIQWYYRGTLYIHITGDPGILNQTRTIYIHVFSTSIYMCSLLIHIYICVLYIYICFLYMHITGDPGILNQTRTIYIYVFSTSTYLFSTSIYVFSTSIYVFSISQAIPTSWTRLKQSLYMSSLYLHMCSLHLYTTDDIKRQLEPDTNSHNRQFFFLGDPGNLNQSRTIGNKQLTGLVIDLLSLIQVTS